MNQSRILMCAAGSLEGQVLMGLQMQKWFPNRWTPVLQISLPRNVNPDDLQTQPEVVQNMVERSIRNALSRWPWPIIPPYAYLDFEPEGGWLWKDSIRNGFSDGDIKLLLFMLDIARKMLPHTKWSYYRLPHVTRKGPFNEQEIEMMQTSTQVVQELDWGTANFYIAPGERQSSEGGIGSGPDDWAARHTEKVVSAMEHLPESKGGRPVPMFWSGWGDFKDYLRLHLSTLHHEASYEGDLAFWFDVQGVSTLDYSGMNEHDGSVQVESQIRTFTPVVSYLQKWLEM